MSETLLSTKPTHKYQIPIDKQGNSIDIEINVEKVRADNLDLQTWGSSLVLASQLHNTPVNVTDEPGIQVLELGAGTALVGLSAAAIWHAIVVLTDVQGVLPGIQRNIEANRQTLESNGGTAVCGTLDWRRPTRLTVQQTDMNAQPVLTEPSFKAQIILLADVIYDEEHPGMLLETISARLRPGPDSRVIVACPQRSAYLDYLNEFWDGLKKLGMEVIQDGVERTEDKWDDENYHEWAVFRWAQS